MYINIIFTDTCKPGGSPSLKSVQLKMRNYFLVVLFFLISAKSTYSSRIELFDRKYAANQTIHFNVLKT